MTSIYRSLTILAVTVGLLMLDLKITFAQSLEMEEKLIPEFNGFDFEYLGAFRFPVNTFGGSRLAYINGNFAINEKNNSVLIVGHQWHQAIAEFSIPEFKKEKNVTSLDISQNMQAFTSILLDETRLENPQGLNRVSGMEIIEGELFVNAVEYYDAPADNTQSTFIVRDIQNLKKSKVDGVFTLQGTAHSAGWMSRLPKKWSDIFVATYLHGYAGNIPINARLSMGPTAFISFIDGLAGINEHDGLIPTRTLMDFSIHKPMIKDLYNKSGENKTWTELSEAYYGFIVPNTDYYLVLGTSGGHDSGVGYKAKQTNGHVCGGPCAIEPSDYYNFYWLFDVNDFVKVKDKIKNPWELLPTHFGKLNLPFAPKSGGKNLISADFDEKNTTLYLLLADADKSQSKYEAAPLMLAYKLNSRIN